MSIWSGSDQDALAYYEYHHSMLLDRNRSEVFLRAIMKTVRPGDVVIDLGTGTGLLSLFSLAAGAEKVYAIEHEPIVDVARQVALVNGVEDRIEFVEGRSTEIELPEKGDVLVTETIGNAGFDEGISAWVLDARARLLKAGARTIPHSLTVLMALLELPTDRDDIETLARPLYTFDLSPLQDLVIGRMAWDELSPVSVVSDSQAVLEWDFAEPELQFSGSCTLTSRRDATVHAIGTWFSAVVADGLVLTNEPPNSTPSWNEGVTMLEKPLDLVAGEQVWTGLEVSPDGSSHRFFIEKQ